MKKIALAIENFSKDGGGAEAYAVELASTLVDDGWEVHCFGEQWGGRPEAAIFHLIQIPQFFPSWLKMLLFALKHRRMVQKQHFDVVMGFGNTICMNVYQSHGGVHWYSTFRKAYAEKKTWTRFFKKILILLSPKHHIRHWIESAPFRQKQLPRLIAISEMIKRDMVSFYKVDSSLVTVIYNGIDVEKFNKGQSRKYRRPMRNKLGLSEQEIVFLFVSFELKKKGIEPLVNAARSLRQRYGDIFKILVVGRTPYPSLSRLIKRVSLEETVIFTGPYKSVREMYAAGDVFVLPTYYDACSLVVLEAMVSGIPPITTDANGIAGIIRNGENGIVLAHPPETHELAAAMESLLDKEKREHMAEAALKLGLQYTNKKNHVAMLEILNRTRARSN